MGDEANHQAAQQAKLDADLAHTLRQVDDTSRLVDARSADLRNKQIALEDCERELHNVRNLNAKLNGENANLKSDNDHCNADNCAMRKNVDCQNVQNGDLAGKIKHTDASLAARTTEVCSTRADVDHQRAVNSSSTHQNNDFNNELKSLENHGSVL